MKPSLINKLFSCLTAVVLTSTLCSSVYAVADRRFDIVTFCCPCSPDQHLCQSQFDHLNWTSANGHFLAMGSDTHRPEVNNNGNFLAVYYDDLNSGYGTITGSAKADAIENTYVIPNFTSNGVKPTWIILNELSAGSWPSDANYRAWVRTVVGRLKTTYGHTVIVCSPFPNPANNAADWQGLSSNSYIAVEKYLSGQDINASGNSVSWCQTQYQSSVNSYASVGVPLSKLYLVEHFANTTTGTGRGRSGVSYAGWDNAINARSTAAHNIGFAGFVSYAWGFDQMLVPDADLLHFEDTYRSKLLP